MNDFEERVRRALGTDVEGVEPDQLLDAVRRGVARRRRRRTAVAVASSILVVAGVAGVAASLQGDERTSPAPVPTQTPSPSQPELPEGATQGVVDVSVASADRWFRLTSNVGCVACSTVWQNEQSAEGGWERLHDFGEEAYVGQANPVSGPIEDLVMAEDGKNGWAWGQRLFSTHDGGLTWTEVTTGPGRVNGEFGHQVAITWATGSAWSLLRTERGTELWRTDVTSDNWVRTDAPNMSGVSGLLTLSDYVLLETSDEGLSAPRLQYFRYGDGLPWGEVANPCPGENRAYPAPSLAYTLCRSGKGATVYRLLGVEHPVAGEQNLRWYEFGRSSGTVTTVQAIDDRRLLIVGRGGKATLLTDKADVVDAPATSTAVDLGLEQDEETGSSSSAGGLTLITTFGSSSGGRILGSTDGGRTWHDVS